MTYRIEVTYFWYNCGSVLLPTLAPGFRVQVWNRGRALLSKRRNEVAQLSDKEKAILKKLQDKSEAPDTPPISKSVSATVDLSNEKSIAAAIKHGFLTADEAEELKDEDDDDKEKTKTKKADATPRRRGYFKDGGSE